MTEALVVPAEKLELLGRIPTQTLIDALALEVQAFAERLHDQLLQVAAEQQQAILVGKDDHVPLPLPITSVVPH